MESNSHTPFLSFNNNNNNQNIAQTSSINLNYFNANKIFDQQQNPQPTSQFKAPINNHIRSHQHHHSISSFMLSTPSNNNINNTTTNAAQIGSNSSSELTNSKFN